jgi:predicted alpha-1,6-mannanase (GH76 family)
MGTDYSYSGSFRNFGTVFTADYVDSMLWTGLAKIYDFLLF